MDGSTSFWHSLFVKLYQLHYKENIVFKYNEGKVATEVLNNIKNNFYKDYCLKSVPSEGQAMLLVSELRAVCATGRFRLTKGVNNSNSMLASCPDGDGAKEITDVNLEKDETDASRKGSRCLVPLQLENEEWPI